MLSSSASKLFGNLCPFCTLFTYITHQKIVLFLSPLFLIQNWVDMICPSLTTLRIIPKILAVRKKEKIKSHLFPLYPLWLIGLISDCLLQKLNLWFAPLPVDLFLGEWKAVSFVFESYLSLPQEDALQESEVFLVLNQEGVTSWLVSVWLW